MTFHPVINGDFNYQPPSTGELATRISGCHQQYHLFRSHVEPTFWAKKIQWDETTGPFPDVSVTPLAKMGQDGRDTMIQPTMNLDMLEHIM